MVLSMGGNMTKSTMFSSFVVSVCIERNGHEPFVRDIEVTAVNTAEAIKQAYRQISKSDADVSHVIVAQKLAAQ
jgi:hypothetical protein